MAGLESVARALVEYYDVLRTGLAQSAAGGDDAACDRRSGRMRRVITERYRSCGDQPVALADLLLGGEDIYGRRVAGPDHPAVAEKHGFVTERLLSVRID